MPLFTGQLNANEVRSSLFNMIISQEVFSDRLQTGDELVDKARVDGSLFGDTKLYYFTDILKTHAWAGDAEAANLLALDRGPSPVTQAIQLNVFRQIRLTLDDYLSKRAWLNDASFAGFTAVLSAYIGKTKDIYDESTYNVYLGTTTSAVGNQSQTVAISSAQPEERAKLIAEKVANILSSLKKPSRSFNDLSQMTKFNESQIKIVWNSKFVNEIRKVDIPAIFHNEGLVDKFAEDVLNEDYFGGAITSKTAAAGDYSGEEQDFVKSGSPDIHCIAGEEAPVGYTGKAYTKDGDVICKIFVKLPPYMSAFEVGSEFDNPRSLTKTRYLTWGHNTIEYLKGYPIITLKAS